MRDEERPDHSNEDLGSNVGRASGSSSEPAGVEPVEAHPTRDHGDALPDNTASDQEQFDESLTEEIAALIDDGRTYAEAELTFRKTQASLAGRKIGGIIVFSVLAIILLHLTLIALAVGMVLALEPLITIWGAIGVVVGALLLGVIVLGLKVRSNALDLAGLFKDESE